MKAIATPTKRMRLWSFNLETALFSLEAGDTNKASAILKDIISEMRGNEHVQ
jgi:hypothetical protein